VIILSLNIRLYRPSAVDVPYLCSYGPMKQIQAILYPYCIRLDVWNSLSRNGNLWTIHQNSAVLPAWIFIDSNFLCFPSLWKHRQCFHYGLHQHFSVGVQHHTDMTRRLKFKSFPTYSTIQLIKLYQHDIDTMNHLHRPLDGQFPKCYSISEFFSALFFISSTFALASSLNFYWSLLKLLINICYVRI